MFPLIPRLLLILITFFSSGIDLAARTVWELVVDFGLAKRRVTPRQLSKAPQPRSGWLDLMVPLQVHAPVRTVHPWHQTIGLHGSPALKQ
jgi:hypothetical protein